MKNLIKNITLTSLTFIHIFNEPNEPVALLKKTKNLCNNFILKSVRDVGAYNSGY